MSENQKYDWQSWRKQQELEQQRGQGSGKQFEQQYGQQQYERQRGQQNYAQQERGFQGNQESARQFSGFEYQMSQSAQKGSAAQSYSRNQERELYDYSQAAIRSEWGSQHAEESAELAHRATIAAGGYKSDEPRVKLRKESEFPSSVMAPYQESSAAQSKGASRSSYGSFSLQDEARDESRGELRDVPRVAPRGSYVADSNTERAGGSSWVGERTAQAGWAGEEFAQGSRQEKSNRNRTRNSLRSDARQEARERVARRRAGASGVAAQPNFAKPKRSKKPFIIAGIILLVSLLAVGGYALATNLGSSNSDNSQLAADEQLNASDAKQAVAPVSDNLVMNLNGDSDTIVLKGEDYIESGCHVINKQTGANLTNQVKTEGNVDTSRAGDYSVTYSVADEAGATCSKERTVHVVDSMDADTDGISVLMYHYVYTDSDRPDDLNGNYILDTDLDAQLAWLESEDYYYPSYEELSAYIAGTHSLPQKSVVVTFDDGETGFLKYGIPLLEKHKVPATSFVIASDVDAADKVKNYASEYVSFQSHSYAMHQAGSDVGRGGRIHAMTQEEILDDLQKAADIVQNNEAMAYPFGDNNETAHAAIRQAGILCAFTINNDQVRPGDDPTCLSRVRISGEYSLDGFTYSVENGVG